MSERAFSELIERVRILRSKPVEPASVSFAPSSGADWSVSLTVDDVRPPDRQRTRNDGRRFREASR